MDNPETQVTLDTRHSMKTNTETNTTQKTKQIGPCYNQFNDINDRGNRRGNQ
jgi:hypothetical protein